MSGAGKVTLIGVRKQERARRAKREEISTDIKGKRTNETFDQWSEHEEKMVTCVGGKDKILVSPIIYWTEQDVWEFLNANNIPHCKLYDEGNTRIGCLCCPMSNHRQKLKDIRKYPHVKRGWIKAIQWLIDNGYIDRNFSDAETGFRWWISGKSFEKFYADEFMQSKIDFDMTRERIERAAGEYSGSVLGFKDNPVVMNKHKAFMDGAQWRINSVWHNLPNDLPKKENTWILLELIFEGRLVYLPVEWVNDGEEISRQVTRWAYIDDLLPERKETNGGR